MAKRGPKPYRPTPFQRHQVRLWSAGGIKRTAICALLKISYETLQKHFAAELEVGPEAMMARNLERFERAAEDGNVAAMRFLDERYATVIANRDFQSEVIEAKPQPQPLVLIEHKGKKQVEMEAAQKAGTGTDWGGDLVAAAALRAVN